MRVILSIADVGLDTEFQLCHIVRYGRRRLPIPLGLGRIGVPGILSPAVRTNRGAQFCSTYEHSSGAFRRQRRRWSLQISSFSISGTIDCIRPKQLNLNHEAIYLKRCEKSSIRKLANKQLYLRSSKTALD